MKKSFCLIIVLLTASTLFNLYSQATGGWVDVTPESYLFDQIVIPEESTGVRYDKDPILELQNIYSTCGLLLEGGQMKSTSDEPVKYQNYLNYLTGLNIVTGDAFREGEHKPGKVLLVNGVNSSLDKFPKMVKAVPGWVNLNFVMPGSILGKYKYSVTIKGEPTVAVGELALSVIRNGIAQMGSIPVSISDSFQTFSMEHEELLPVHFNTMLRLSYPATFATKLNSGYLAISSVSLHKWVAQLPEVSVSSSNVTGFMPSAIQTIQLSGANMSSNRLYLEVADPDAFEISVDGTKWESRVYYSPTDAKDGFADGAIAAQDLHIRMRSGLAVGSYRSSISISGGGNLDLYTTTITLEGNAPIMGAATEISASGFRANWNKVPDAISYELNIINAGVQVFTKADIAETTILVSDLTISSGDLFEIQVTAKGVSNAVIAVSETISISYQSAVEAEDNKPISAAPHTTVTLASNTTHIPSATVGVASTVVIPSTNAALTIASLRMEAGVLEINNTEAVTIGALSLYVADQQLPRVVNTTSSAVTASDIYLYRSFIKDQYNPISFPFAISAIEYKGGDGNWTPAISSAVDATSADYLIQYYDGAKRAAQGNVGWTNLPAGFLPEAIKGYTIITRHGGAYRFKAADVGSLFAVGGDQTIAVSANTVSDGRVHDAGWNFVGNPYADKITPTMHYTACSIDHATGKTTYNVVASTENIATPQFAGYFVQVGSETTTIPYSRASAKSIVSSKELIAMEYAGERNSATSYIITRENSTLGYELEADLEKIASDIPTYAEMWQREGGYNMSINDRPINSTLTTIALTFKSGAAGDYRFRLSDITAPYQYSSISLVNTTTGQSQELLQGQIAQLPQGANEVNLDYELRLSKVTTGVSDIEDNLQVYANSHSIYVEGIEGAATIELIDLQGRTLYREDTHTASVVLSRPQAAVLMVRVTQGDIVINRKVK